MTRQNIVGGPSKFDLMLALFCERRVYFSVEGRCLDLIITKLEAEDNSRENWFFEACSATIPHSDEAVVPSYQGSFSTSTRDGWIEEKES